MMLRTQSNNSYIELFGSSCNDRGITDIDNMNMVSWLTHRISESLEEVVLEHEVCLETLHVCVCVCACVCVVCVVFIEVSGFQGLIYQSLYRQSCVGRTHTPRAAL